jgi:antitoxin MazE
LTRILCPGILIVYTEVIVRTKIVKWGNSLGLRIPRSFAAEVLVTEGSTVDLGLEDGRLVVSVIPPRQVDLESLLAGVTAENLHDEVDTGSARGGEVW